MRISKSQIAAISITGVLVLLLTYMGMKSDRVSFTGESSVKSGHSLEAVTEAEIQGLADSLKVLVENHSPDLQKSTVALLDSLGKRYASAKLMMQVAEQNPEEANWMIAGSKYYTLAVMSNDSVIFRDAGHQASTAFAKALEINPGNLDAKNALASCYVDVDRDIMKGVGLLKEVLATDSSNVQALFTLGMLSIQSGQWAKARERFEKLTELHPFNPEYYYYLGEVFAKSGEVQKAVSTYEKCKTLIKDKEAQKEIQNLIDKLKTI